MPTITVTYVANANPSIQVNPGNQDMGKGSKVITWNATNCSFPTTNGIVFVPTTDTPAVWPNEQPAYSPSSGNYTVTDVNGGGSTIQYNYNVSVITHGGHTHQRLDPDVTNTPE